MTRPPAPSAAVRIIAGVLFCAWSLIAVFAVPLLALLLAAGLAFLLLAGSSSSWIMGLKALALGLVWVLAILAAFHSLAIWFTTAFLAAPQSFRRRLIWYLQAVGFGFLTLLYSGPSEVAKSGHHPFALLAGVSALLCLWAAVQTTPWRRAGPLPSKGQSG